MSFDAFDLTPLAAHPAVHLREDPEFERHRLPWNLAARCHPVAVAVPETVADVVHLMRTAADVGLRVAPQSTGHHAAALDDVSLDDTLLIRMNRLVGVDVDPAAGTARVLGGTLWRDVIAAASHYGMTALHGSAGDVSVVGYLLGGGLSFYGRAHGLAANAIRAIEVVTVDGTHLRATADADADLLWAVRGGGGNFGVVVAVEIDLLRIPDVVAGMMLWDIERSPEVLRTWARWTEAAPESATTSLRIMRFPPLPDLPPFLSGRQIAVIDGAVLDDDERATELLAPLRALSAEMDTFTRIPTSAVIDMHMDPPDPMPGVSDHTMLSGLPDDAIASLLAAVGPGVETPS